MDSKNGLKPSEIIVEELKRRSKKPLDLASRTILAEKIENQELREALEYYAKSWCDFTHSGAFSLACEAVGGDLDTAVPVQAAITTMAAAFDIQDDIIDNSRAKHGLPTVFGKYGTNRAMLLANAFLIEGFTLLAEQVKNSPRRKAADILGIIKKSLFEVGNAHALELNLKRRVDVKPEEYMRIFEMKGAAIEADMHIGAILGNGTTKETKALKKYGRILGLLTQLREEFIDIFEVEELRHRLRNEYPPIPLLYLMQDAKSKGTIIEILAEKRMGNSDLDKLVDMVFKAKAVRELRKKMEELVDGSIQSISKLRKSESKHMLCKLATSMLEDL
jgi:geranylgeranyl pyrophosphate synthase